MHKFASYITALRGWKRYGFLFCCGGVTAFALAPFYLFPICFLTFPFLVLFLDSCFKQATLKARIISAAITCWVFGFGYFVFALWWLSNALLVDSTDFAWAIPFAIFGLPAYLAIYWAIAGCLAGLLWKTGASRLFTLAWVIGLGEYLRGTLLTGFPWASIGYTLMPTPLLMQSDAFVGLYAMNALAVLLYAIPVVFFTSERKIPVLLFGVALFCAHVGFGMYRLHNVENIDAYKNSKNWVRLVQPSIKQNEKLDNDVRFAMFQAHINLSEKPADNTAHEADIIVWPETSVPYILDYVPEAKMRIAKMLKPMQWAIVGAVRADGSIEDSNKNYFNTIDVVDGAGNILAQSDKLHLVPFGEYLPYQNLFDLIGLKAIADMTGGYSAAQQRNTVTLPNGFIYLPMICYEVIFPNGMDYKGAPPQAILNVTNDAWFGATPGPYQHLHQARLRAVELGVPLIRAANNGISAVVDPYGRIIASLELNAIGILDAPVPQPIVSIWNTESRNLHALFIYCFILTLSIIRNGSKFRRSIDNS